MEEELKGHDYMNRSLVELQSHPDFNELAFRVVAEVSTMNSHELELLSYSMFI